MAVTYQSCSVSAAYKVFSSRHARVIGPTPPGTGEDKLTNNNYETWSTLMRRRLHLDPTDTLENLDLSGDEKSCRFASVGAGQGVTNFHNEPRTFKKAMACPDAIHWARAMVREVVSLLANTTFNLKDIVSLDDLKNSKALGTK